MKYLLDTNIITAIMKQNDKVKKRAQQAILTGDDIFINGISYYEIKRGLLYKDAKNQLGFFIELCKRYELVLLNSQSVFDRAASIYTELRHKGKEIHDADILIASIADTGNFTLVSNNVTHFNNIQDLSVEDWLN